MSLPTPELINKVQLARQKIADGTITLDEQKEMILILRNNRMAAAAQPKASKAKSAGRTKIPSKSADDMLSELE